MPFHLPATAFNGVAAGGTAFLELPTDANLKYDGLTLYWGSGKTIANTISDIEEIRVMINGKPKRRMSALDLYIINKQHGIDPQGGVLPIVFAEKDRRTEQSKDALAWCMGDVQTFRVEVDIASGATGASLACIRHYERLATPAALGAIVQVSKRQIGVTSTGVRNVHDFEKGPAYLRAHLIETTAGDISKVEVYAGEEKRFDMTRAQADDVIGDEGFATDLTGIQAGLSAFPLFFDTNKRLSSALPTKINGKLLASFRVDMTMAVAADVTALIETIGPGL